MNAPKIVTSVFFNYVGAITVSLLGFVSTPILLHHLGKGAFGALALLGAMVGYTALLDLGVGLTVMRMVAERAHLSDRRELTALASTGLVIYGSVGLLILLIVCGAAPFIAHAFTLSGVSEREFTIAFLLVVGVFGLTFPAGLFTGINQGFGHYRQQNVIVVSQALAGTGLGIAVVLLGGGLVELAATQVAVAAAALLVKAAYARRAFGIAPSPRAFDRRVARMVMGVSAWIFMLNVATKVIWDADAIVIGAILGTVAVSQYAVALGPATAIRRLTDQFNSVSLTAASSLRAQGERAGLQRLLMEATRIVTLFVCPFLVLFALWGEDFLRLWVGPDLVGSAGTLLVLVAGMLSSAVQATATQVLLALHKQRLMAAVAVLEGASNLTLSIVLAHHLGIIGVALGTAIPTTLTAFGFYLPYASRLVGLSVHRVMGRLLLPAAVCGSAYLGLRPVADHLHFPSLVVFMLFAGAFVVACIVVTILLDARERRTYLAVARTLIGRVGRGRPGRSPAEALVER
jgi:O-antigen/teichoic acid export membrane protein